MPYKPFTEGPTRPQFSRSRAFDVEHVRLDLRIDPPGRRLSGEAAIRVRPIHEVRSLEFDAVEQAFMARGRSLQDATLEEMEAEWQRVKHSA